MLEAIRQYVEREEKREVFKQDALCAWQAYQQSGLHLTLEEADGWLAKLEAGDDESWFEALAKATGRTKTFYVREAILDHLDDLEDLYLAEKRLIDNRAGRSRTYTLEEVERDLGLAD